MVFHGLNRREVALMLALLRRAETGEARSVAEIAEHWRGERPSLSSVHVTLKRLQQRDLVATLEADSAALESRRWVPTLAGLDALKRSLRPEDRSA